MSKLLFRSAVLYFITDLPGFYSVRINAGGCIKFGYSVQLIYRYFSEKTLKNWVGTIKN